MGSGTAALNAYAQWTFEGNVLAGANAAVYPANNFYPANFPQDIGFVDPANGDFRLSSSSPYKGRATDGGDPGVDFNALWAKTARARSGIPETSMGDFDGDRDVDAADYVVWRKTDGTQAGLDAWRANFGISLSVGSGVTLPAAEPPSSAVPEPVSALLLVFGVVFEYWRVRQSASQCHQLVSG